MQYISAIWIAVLLINIIFLLLSMKIRNNMKLLIASLVVVILNFGSYLILYFTTNGYTLLIPSIESCLILFMIVISMIISLILLTLRVKRENNIYSMVFADIITGSVAYITYTYIGATQYVVNYDIIIIIVLKIVSFLFLATLIGKWMYISVKE